MRIMTCSCVHVDDFDIDLYPQFLKRKTHVARKEHECGECSRMIKPGEQYEYVVGKWEGMLEIHKTCNDCLSIRKSFFCNGYFYGGIFEYLQDHIHDMGGKISSNCIVPLTPKAREIVCAMIEDCWDEDE